MVPVYAAWVNQARFPIKVPGNLGFFPQQIGVSKVPVNSGIILVQGNACLERLDSPVVLTGLNIAIAGGKTFGKIWCIRETASIDGFNYLFKIGVLDFRDDVSVSIV